MLVCRVEDSAQNHLDGAGFTDNVWCDHCHTFHKNQISHKDKHTTCTMILWSNESKIHCCILLNINMTSYLAGNRLELCMIYLLYHKTIKHCWVVCCLACCTLLLDFQKWHYQVSQDLPDKIVTSFLEVTFGKNHSKI